MENDLIPFRFHTIVYFLEYAGNDFTILVPCGAFSGERLEKHPHGAAVRIRDHVAFFADRMDACWIGSERVTPQPGGFYGGWITSNVVGPFKGEPGSWGW